MPEESNYTEPFNPQETEGINCPMCERCKCCDTEWDTCDICCGEGTDGHDCGEDTCCCLYPEDNLECDYCGGQGGSYRCIGACDANGKHRDRFEE